MFAARDRGCVTDVDENARRPGKGGITDFDPGRKAASG